MVGRIGCGRNDVGNPCPPPLAVASGAFLLASVGGLVQKKGADFGPKTRVTESEGAPYPDVPMAESVATSVYIVIRDAVILLPITGPPAHGQSVHVAATGTVHGYGALPRMPLL